MIVTVTLNPALLVSYEAAHVRAGGPNQVRRVRYAAGGRGLSVARILHTFGHEVTAAGVAGGSTSELIRAALARDGIATRFTPIMAETRRMLTITDVASGATTSFSEPAPYITTEELGRLAVDYRALLAGATVVVLCGSLPDSLPAEIYGSFASYAADAGVPVVLNASGQALAYGASRRPALVVPEPDVTSPAGAACVALPTAGGVRVTTPAGAWQARLSQTPAGQDARDAAYMDALVAGFVPGIALAWSWPDILRHALAIAAAWSPVTGLGEQAYEEALAAVLVDRLPAGNE